MQRFAIRMPGRVITVAWLALELLAAAALAAMPLAASAQAYPSRPIRWIVSFAAGSSYDVLSRTVAAQMASAMGQPIVVENRSGASGIVATEFVAKSAADGYTLVSADNSTYVYNPLLYRKLPYDADRDLQPVGLLGGAPLFLTVAESTGLKSMKEFIEYVRANPGKMSYGSAGSGSIQHMSIELLKKAAGLDMVHVPYKGAALAVPDLIAGRIGVMILVYGTALPHVTSGKLRILATTDGARAAMLPDTPTVSEAGLPGFEVPAWFGGVAAPAGVPPEIIARLNQEVRRASADPKVAARVREIGYTVPPAMDPQQIGEMYRKERVTWTPLIRSMAIALD